MRGRVLQHARSYSRCNVPRMIFLKELSRSNEQWAFLGLTTITAYYHGSLIRTVRFVQSVNEGITAYLSHFIDDEFT